MTFDLSNQKRYKIPIEKLFYSLNGGEISLVTIATLAISCILSKKNIHPINDVKVEEPKAREYLLLKIHQLNIPINLGKILFENTIFLRICYFRVNYPFSFTVLASYKLLSELIDEYLSHYRIDKKNELRNLMSLQRNSRIRRRFTYRF